MPKTKVLLVTRSAAVRMSISKEIQGCDDITLVGTAADLRDAYSAAEFLAPDLAIVSDELAREPGFEVLTGLFTTQDTRWCLVQSGTGSSALSDGASGIFPFSILRNPNQLGRHIRALVRVRASQTSQRAPDTATQFREKCIVLIGSSTGGIEALTEVLKHYPKNCPPTLIVQHTGAAFAESLVRLMRMKCPANVVAARPGLQVKSGTVVVAGGTQAHLVISPSTPITTRMNAGVAVSGHMPSVDQLFRSALPHAKNVVACLLTGMGRDGAEGLLSLRHAGAKTYAQDEKSSVVYGMPKVAWEIGAVEERVPITQMGKKILNACATAGPKQAVS